MSEELIKEAAKVIVNSKHLIALTGAGVSAESGVPTFRGEDGLWRRFRAEELATPEAFRRDPKLVWEWYVWRMGIVFKAKPNPAHEVLAKLEGLGILKCLITQNVDGLHQIAGSRRVIELHGSLRRVRCVSCNYKEVINEPPKEIPPKCPKCGSVLRPDVVWFGEPIPEDAWRGAMEHTYRADALLVIGTSAVVAPASYIPHIVKSRGGYLIEINVGTSAITHIADAFIKEPAGKALPKILKYILKELK